MLQSLTLLAVVLKIATLAPEGSAWMNLFHKWQARVEQRTEGRVKVKFYAGGVMGDERDVIRKMHAGQLSGAAITGIGLAMINPEVRALEAARTYPELDHARERLDPLLRKKFDEKGYLLMGWGDVGPVHIFSQRPIRSLDDLRQTKLWMFGDDPLTKQTFAALGLHGVPMGVPEVLPSLATGSIDAFFGSPLSTVALQWSAHAKYVTSAVIGMATGATVLTKVAWGQLEPRDQQIVTEEAHAMEDEVTKQVRNDNTEAFDQLQKKNGLQVVPTPLEMQRDVATRVMAIADKANAQFSKEFQVEVVKLLEEYRKAHPGELPQK
jgi:TRAP-type C4-dicarboxylate transport system substrate-binding protein